MRWLERPLLVAVVAQATASARLIDMLIAVAT
jgi:hypothetical protein